MEIDRSVSPEQIRWYLDGTNYFTVNANQVDATTWTNAVDHPFFIIFDLAMGGGFPDAFGGGPNAATVSGGQMIVDYVAVYNKPPVAAAATTPPPRRARPITGPGGLCLDVRASEHRQRHPVQLWTCNGTGAQQWTVDSGQHAARARQVPGHHRRRHRQRHEGAAVGLQQHRRPGLHPQTERPLLQPAVEQVPGRHRHQHGRAPSCRSGTATAPPTRAGPALLQPRPVSGPGCPRHSDDGGSPARGRGAGAGVESDPPSLRRRLSSRLSAATRTKLTLTSSAHEPNFDTCASSQTSRWFGTARPGDAADQQGVVAGALERHDVLGQRRSEDRHGEPGPTRRARTTRSRTAGPPTDPGTAARQPRPPGPGGRATVVDGAGERDVRYLR